MTEPLDILTAIGTLCDATADEIRHALDLLEDSDNRLDEYARDRVMIAAELIKATDEDCAWLLEMLALSTPLEHRRIPFTSAPNRPLGPEGV